MSIAIRAFGLWFEVRLCRLARNGEYCAVWVRHFGPIEIWRWEAQ